MNDNFNTLDLIPYEEMARILFKEFKATHEEIRYWIKLSLKEKDMLNKTTYLDVNGDPIENLMTNNVLIQPYYSDIPFKGFYLNIEDDFFYPEYFFYDRQEILKFKPLPHVRFVYQKDLSAKRNWNDPQSTYKILLQANLKGILRLYHTELDEFTYFANKSQIWCNTFDGEAYCSNPDSFFLLYDIINIERIFFKKDRDLCLQELGEQVMSPSPLPPNVYDFKKKSETPKDTDDD